MESRIKHWLESLKRSEIIPEQIIAINFGIIEEEEEYKICLTGSDQYSKEDDTWAQCVRYQSQNKALGLGRNSKKYHLMEVLNKVKNALMQEFGRPGLFDKVSVVTTGFEEGDLYRIR